MNRIKDALDYISEATPENRDLRIALVIMFVVAAAVSPLSMFYAIGIVACIALAMILFKMAR